MHTLVDVLFAIAAAIALLYILDLISHKRMNAGLVQVEASDLTTFYVKDLENKAQAAELLARTRQKLFAVLSHIKETPDASLPPHLVTGLHRLVRKHCHRLHLNELDATEHNTVAMNRKKGQEIHVCLRKCPDCLNLAAEDRLFIVALHEIAHSATAGYDPNVNGVTQHGDEFKRYEHYLIEVAQKMGLLNPSAVIGKNFCGVQIPPVANPPI